MRIAFAFSALAFWVMLIQPLCLRAQTDPPQETKPKLPPVKTSITVTETISAEAPASITVLDQRRIDEEPGINLDDRLRAVPGFSLFRRSSSIVANPTTQGISLRGIGSSGASRTLLLWDGIPENDPFGGWVYWDRFAPQEMDRIEISRGASTSVFGDLALGGAIALFSRTAAAHHYDASYEGGNKNTHEVTAGASNLWRHFAISGFGRAFTTDGYFVVPSSVRGPIDTRAGVRFVAADTRLDFFGAADRFFLRFDVLAEHRENGTTLTTNSTGLGSIAANYSHEWQHDQVSLLGYHTRESFRASFSAVGARRASETLSYHQTVPSQATGGAALWRHAAAHWHVLAGADTEHVQGTSTDRLFPTLLRIGGGSIIQRGVFAQGDVSLGPVNFFVGARHHVTGRGDTFFSPSGGFSVGRGLFRARGSVYRAFRAPTLNELYREFRVGNTITRANPALIPEKLFGAELGFDLVGESTRASFTFFRNDLTGLITNVTLQTGSTIIRQRQNAASALSRGLEANVRHGWNHWRGELAYLFADSRYVTGPRIPQVPKQQGSGSVAFQARGTSISADVRSYSLQFEDDVNQFRLPGFASVQLAAEQRLTNSLSARAAFENLLDREYLTGFSPTPTIGAPRLWRIGLKWEHR
jgi:outer membrane receptor protein involved in Fe transport